MFDDRLLLSLVFLMILCLLYASVVIWKQTLFSRDYCFFLNKKSRRCPAATQLVSTGTRRGEMLVFVSIFPYEISFILDLFQISVFYG